MSVSHRSATDRERLVVTGPKPSRSLGCEQEFPPDLVDEILCWSCEGRPSRALRLALVCRLWYDRFKAADRLWPLIVRRLQPKMMIATRTATYVRVQDSINAMKQLHPLQPSSLHPIEECTLEFACPIYAEGLRVVAPGVSYCSVCKENVYTVRTQAQMDAATRRGRCVQFSSQDLAIDAEDETMVRIAVIIESEKSALTTARAIAANPVFNCRSASIFPVLLLKAPFTYQIELHFFTIAELSSFPIDAPQFSLLAAVPEVKLDTLPLRKPFQVALQTESILIATSVEKLPGELSATIQKKYGTRRVMVRGKRMAPPRIPPVKRSG